MMWRRLRVWERAVDAWLVDELGDFRGAVLVSLCAGCVLMCWGGFAAVIGVALVAAVALDWVGARVTKERVVKDAGDNQHHDGCGGGGEVVLIDANDSGRLSSERGREVDYEPAVEGGSHSGLFSEPL